MGDRPHLREVDVDLGDSATNGQRSRTHGGWSIANLGIPLPMVAVLLVQTVVVVLWVGKQSTKLDTVIEQTRAIQTEIYKQGDATRDLARRDDHIAELGRRIELLEKFNDGRRR